MIKGKFSIVMPAHKLFKRDDKKYELEAAIDSVLDQDYKNYELIIAANGSEGPKVAKYVREKYPKLQVVLVEEANACSARNAGAKVADGEFYTFISSDFVLRPGALRFWKEAFDENPKAALVYSEYGLIERGEFTGQVASTFDFDYYMLTSFNYIDGGFPVRSKDYLEWDPTVKSLNDWEWLLRILKGKLAVRIKDIGYDAEVPKEEGLSDDSANNWLERVADVKKKAKIPVRKTVISSLGAPFHGMRLAKAIGADFNYMPSNKPHTYDTVYLLGYYANNDANLNAHNSVFHGSGDSIRIIHWIGSDIMYMMGQYWEVNRNIVNTLNQYIDIQLCECGATQYELAEMGINAKVLPLPQEVDKYPFYTAWPKKFTVAIYNPKGDESTRRKYFMDDCEATAESMPDVNFIFFGGGERRLKVKNVKYLDWVDIKDVAKKSNMVLRYTFHDGLPISPLEFIMMGRTAMITVPGIKGTYGLENGREKTPEERKKLLITGIRQVQENPMKLKDRKKYSDYWKKELSPAKFKRRLKKLIKDRKEQIKGEK